MSSHNTHSESQSTIIEPQDPAQPEDTATPDPFRIDHFEDGDPDNPKNWGRLRKWYLTALSSFLVLNATFASSAPSGSIQACDLIKQFPMSQEVATLTISVFVAGYCVGPLLWGPLSEQYGRRPIFVYPFFVYTIFQVGTAFSPNVGGLIALRFIGGTFAAAPLTNSGAIIADIWDAKTRGKALALFTLSPFMGPSVGPLVAGFCSVAGLPWNTIFWIMTGFAGACWIAIVLTIPETYAPAIFAKKAAMKRKSSGDDRYYAPLERHHPPFAERVKEIVAKPFVIMFQEPMLIAVTVYMSFVYGCLYLLFEAYPIVFAEGHHLNAGMSGLMFLPIPIGGALSVTLYTTVFNPRYERLVNEYAPHPVPPEHRLSMTRLGAPLFCVSFFWFGWTSYPSISLWAPMMAGLLMGFSINSLFLNLFTYIIDAYLMFAASALASNTIVRSLFGAAFPLFASQMYAKLNPRWASSLLGFIALAMIPIPFVLIKFGPTLRQRSKYAPTQAPPQTSAEKKESDV